jgi:hypothetical protein
MMRNIIIAILALLIVGCGKSESPSPSATSTVQESFASLKTALREGDGKAAVSRVTPATLEFYERCRQLALDSSGTDFESISQFEVILTFQLRWLLDKASLESMDGEGVFVWGVEGGMVKKEMLEAIDLDKVQLEGNKAMATLRNQGQRVTDLVLDFELHDRIWKLDFEGVLSSANRAFDQIRENSGKTKIELAIYLIETTYEEEVPPQILNGPLK